MRTRGLRAFAFFAGAALLSAEVVWNRTLLVITGGSVDSTSIVLSAVMAGLAAGSILAGRLADSSLDPAGLLRRVTLACAAAFLLPLLLSPLAARVYPALTASWLPLAAARAVTAYAMILPPSILAGGLIPLLARLSDRTGGVGGISGLYALNTLGSSLGGLLTGFVLLEVMGARLALASSCTLMSASSFLVSNRGGPAVIPDHRSDIRSSGSYGPRPVHLALYLVSGMTALSLEAVWARQLTFILGNSTYAFSAMGASVLLGLSIGTWAAKRLKGRPLPLFGVAVALEGVLGALPLLVASCGISIPSPAFLPRGVMTAMLASLSMIPASCCMGATFPLMVGAAAREGRLGLDVGVLSMANSIGAALGPFFSSSLLMALFGPTHGTGLVALLAAATGAAAAGAGGRPRLALALPVLVLPAVVASLLLPPPGSRPPSGDLHTVFFDEDRVATVAVFAREWDGYRSLRINGVEEVPIDQASLEAFHLLGHLPWGYNPGAGDVLLIALGGGITSGSILCHDVDSVTCAEICPSVADASPFFAAENCSPELDPRFALVGDDGRNFLSANGKMYDLIICDATHPGSSDSWVLYTREFYSSALSHLEPGGVAAQWVPLHQLPVGDLERILSTWISVFPNSAVHIAGGRHAVLIGSADPLVLDMDALFDSQDARESLGRTAFCIEETSVLEPVATTSEIEAGTADAGINTDDHAPCQFLRRRVPVDPQATIAPCVAFLLSLRGEADPLREGQMLYWSGRLPEAAETFGSCPGPMGRRWLSVSLTSAAEILLDRGDGAGALQLARQAVEADPGWPIPRALVETIPVPQ